MVYLTDIHPENWRLGLKVKQEQVHFVSDEMRLLARAYAFRDYRSRAVIIESDGVPVGMALYYDCDALSAYDFSQLFIDARYQGKGYGTAAVQAIIAAMRADGKYDRCVLCFIDGNTAACALYQKCGFHLTGETDGDEIIMELCLR